jgi:Tfp pilus assembly protein PilW
MVAMLLGLFLMFGAVTVYTQSRATYRTTEAVARLQEVGRLALNVIETDLRMANYWGLSNKSEYVLNAAAPGEPSAFSTEPIQAAIDACGSNWGINLDAYLEGSNNGYDLTCDAFGDAAAGSDAVTVRRASEVNPTKLDPDRIYLQTSRIQGTLFVPDCASLDPKDIACIPAAYSPPASQSRELLVRTYYVDASSTMRGDFPSLRRKVFSPTSPGARDEEIVPGVEDMQIQFGVDTTNDFNADSYVDTDAVPAGARIVSVTVWLRIRSEEPEMSQVDGRSYQYADMASAYVPGDRYRRIVVSKTIQLRNTRS